MCVQSQPNFESSSTISVQHDKTHEDLLHRSGTCTLVRWPLGLDCARCVAPQPLLPPSSTALFPAASISKAYLVLWSTSRYGAMAEKKRPLHYPHAPLYVLPYRLSSDTVSSRTLLGLAAPAMICPLHFICFLTNYFRMSLRNRRVLREWPVGYVHQW